MGTIANAREHARALVLADIVSEARRQLAAEGAATISLRAVARELGMASSAIYRYVQSRDELLTLLIIDAYESIGEAAEKAAATAEVAQQKWRQICGAIRMWALDHPHEYALIFGSPVPGYHAPHATTESASRVTKVISKLLRDAQLEGTLRTHSQESLPDDLTMDVQKVANIAMPEIPLTTVARSLTVWAMLFGQISFEVFGRFDDITQNPQALFEYSVTRMAEVLGLK